MGQSTAEQSRKEQGWTRQSEIEQKREVEEKAVKRKRKRKKEETTSVDGEAPASREGQKVSARSIPTIACFGCYPPGHGDSSRFEYWRLMGTMRGAARRRQEGRLVW